MSATLQTSRLFLDLRAVIADARRCATRRRRRQGAVVLAIAAGAAAAVGLASLGGGSPALAGASGVADGMFGVGGQVVGPAGEPAALVGQPDGKLVVAGAGTKGFLVARYRSDGSPDSTFGERGVTELPIGSGPGIAGVWSLGIEADGKIVAGGNSATRGVDAVTLVRFDRNGQIDSTFGARGLVRVPRANLSVMTLQKDGRIVVAGTGAGGTRVMRFLPGGSPDPSFGTRGVAAVASLPIDPVAAVVEPDGKIAVAGIRVVPPGVRSVAVLLRLRRDGSPDEAFGSGGVTTVRGASFQSLVRTRDGGFVAAGYVSTEERTALFRFLPNGLLDRSFGHGGVATARVADGRFWAGALALMPDGKLIAGGGQSRPGPTPLRPPAFALVRFLPNGSIDRSFGVDGEVRTRIGPPGPALSTLSEGGVQPRYWSTVKALLRQPDGGLVALGPSRFAGGLDRFTLVRYR